MINGSPNKKRGTSSYLLKEIYRIGQKEKLKLKEFLIQDVFKDKSKLEEICSYDKILFSFPLYFDSPPSILIEFLNYFEVYIRENNVKPKEIYAICNCGFIEPRQNDISLEVIQCFADKMNMHWKYGIGVGGGIFLKKSFGIPIKFFIKKKIYNALLQLVKDMKCDKGPIRENIYVKPLIPKRLFILMGNSHWVNAGSKNLSKEELIYAPYR